MNKINTKIYKVGTFLLKFTLFAPFLLALATVFVIDHHLANGVVSGKYFWFYGSMGLIGVSTLIHSFIPSTPQSFRFSATDAFVVLFAGSVFLSAWVHGDSLVNTTKLALLALLLILYFCLRFLLEGEGQKAKGARCRVRGKEGNLRTIICVFLILTGLVEAVWGLLQLYGFKSSQHAIFKLTGSFFNPGPYAGYLAVVFPMALHFITPKSPKGDLAAAGLKVLGAATCITVILVLPAAMSRASWLAAIAGSAVAVAPRLSSLSLRLSPFIRRLSIILLLGLLLSAITGMYYLKKNSADGRLLTWKVSFTALAHHPWGVGLGHFPSAYGDAQAAYFASGKASETEEYVAGNPEYGFNEFLQIAIESGIVSLGLFITILVFAFRGLIKNKNWGATGSLSAMLVFACFSYPFSVLPFPIIFVFLLAMSTPPSPLKREPESEFVPIAAIKSPLGDLGVGLCVKRAITKLLSVICVICVPLLLYKQYPVYVAYKQWNNSRIYYQTGMYREAAANYEPLYPFLNDQIQFLFEYGRSLSQDSQEIAGQARNDKIVQGDPVSSSGRNDRLMKSNEVLQQAAKISCDPMLYNIMGKNYQALKKYDLAEQCLLKSTHIVPNRLYPYYLLMKLYIETGDERKARETAGIVLTKEPKVQSQAVKEMREEAGGVMN